MQKTNEPLGTRATYKMLEIINDPSSYNIYFDNFFLSYNLFTSLKERSYRAMGTMWDNRNNVSIKEFRWNIAVPYLKLRHGKRILEGKLVSFPSKSKAKITDDVRFDGKGHILEKQEKPTKMLVDDL